MGLQDPGQLVSRFASLVTNLAQVFTDDEDDDRGGDREGEEETGWVSLKHVKEPRDGVGERQAYQLENGNTFQVNYRGDTQVSNSQSGVIYEEHPEGTVLVSLPDGRFIQQAFEGEPWLLYDPNDEDDLPRPVRTGRIRLPGEDRPRFVYSFREGHNTHVIDAETLQYYVARPPADPRA